MKKILLLTIPTLFLFTGCNTLGNVEEHTSSGSSESYGLTSSDSNKFNGFNQYEYTSFSMINMALENFKETISNDNSEFKEDTENVIIISEIPIEQDKKFTENLKENFPEYSFRLYKSDENQDYKVNTEDNLLIVLKKGETDNGTTGEYELTYKELELLGSFSYSK